MSITRREKGSSILRVLEIIEAIANASKPMTPTELAKQLDIPKATGHRLIQTLEKEGFLQTNMRGFVVPGARLHQAALGIIYAGRYKAQRRAILEHLSNAVGETCGIAIPDGTEMLYFDRVQTNWPLQINLPVGSHTPSWCTASGKLYLANLPLAQRRLMLEKLPIQRLSRNTLTDPEELLDELAHIEQQGLAVDNEEFIDGMVACAVPVRDALGRLIACLFTHAPVIRCSLEDLLQFEPQLREAAAQLEQIIQVPAQS
ncbi:IclR family transcriptional regulator [Marinobacterium zhoushanense]|uniref:HTH-type transcriptional repressor AllR n=1 Tax=Marinobacterium zhoushanense TaxID=1679163 RepID=A0ABQ1KUC3_9GAMM|nr:IclR family transcriptional regulator [Marinobacterium zhoushanense]GGC09592.1 IclR family transcriptional regulator [Marinobacterium zhoushanense]